MKAVITKVQSGDADAGIAYVTDVTPELADELTLIPIPDDGERHRDLSDRGRERIPRRPMSRRAFIDYVLGDGQPTLAEYGFLPPP